MENEELKNDENTELVVKSFNDMEKKSNTKKDIFTNITDKKMIFNLESNVDYKINDCKGEFIRVKQVLIKRFEKPLEEPAIEASTGEIIKDKDIKIVTILIDDNNKSYVTASKSFGIQMMNYIRMFGLDDIENEGLEIKIIERPVQNSQNKALGFELL